MKKQNRLKILISTALISLIGIFLYFSGYFDAIYQLFGDVEYIQSLVEGRGVYGLFMLLALQLVILVIAPIPGHAIGVAYGLIYGVYWGTLFGLIGTTIGTIIAVLISKKYGKPLVESVVGEEKMDKYEDVTDSTDIYPFVILIIFPLIPGDIIPYLAGLTNIKTKRIIIWLSIARIPGLVSLTWFGESLATANYTIMLLLVAIIILVSALAYWKKQKIINSLTEQ